MQGVTTIRIKEIKAVKNMTYLVILFIGIIGVFYYNTFEWLINSWTNNQYYSHGFLVPIISGYIIWSMRKELHNIEKKQSQTGLILFIVGIVIQGIAILLTIRFLSGLSLIVTILGIILYLYGWEFTKKISFPIAFLLLAIPVPFVDMIAPPAQVISAIASTDLANVLNIPVSREGLLLHTPKGTFEVAVECSGLKSIISLLTLSIIYAFILEGGLLMKSTIVLSSIPLAMFGNIARITSMLAVANKYGQEAALNYFHDFSSLLLFSIALIGLFTVGRLFGKLRFKKVF